VGVALDWYLNRPEELEALFQERFRRPPPWMERATPDELQNLAWGLSGKIKLKPPSGDLQRVLDAAWEKIPGRTQADCGACRGGTEQLSRAVARCAIPTDGPVLMWHRDGRGVRLRMRDMVEFEDALWSDEMWLIDEELKWLLVGEHDWPVYYWRF
jgi:hypothetical protein